MKSTASIILKHDLNSRKLADESTNQFEDGRRLGSSANGNEAFIRDRKLSANRNTDSESDDTYVNVNIKSCKMSEKHERRKNDFQKVDISVNSKSGLNRICVEEDNCEYVDDVIYDTPKHSISEAQIDHSSQNSIFENMRKKVNWCDCVTWHREIYICINQTVDFNINLLKPKKNKTNQT